MVFECCHASGFRDFDLRPEMCPGFLLLRGIYAGAERSRGCSDRENKPPYGTAGVALVMVVVFAPALFNRRYIPAECQLVSCSMSGMQVVSGYVGRLHMGPV